MKILNTTLKKLLVIAMTMACLISVMPSAVYAASAPAAKPLPTNLTSDPIQNLVLIAKSQVGYKAASDNMSAYKEWTGWDDKNDHTDGRNGWCDDFVAWCAYHAGYTDAKNVNNSANASTNGGGEWYIAKMVGGLTYLVEGGMQDHGDNSNYLRDVGANGAHVIKFSDIKVGDIIETDTDGNIRNSSDHVEIVTAVSANSIHTVEGNYTVNGVGSVHERDISISEVSCIGVVVRPQPIGAGPVDDGSIQAPKITNVKVYKHIKQVRIYTNTGGGYRNVYEYATNKKFKNAKTIEGAGELSFKMKDLKPGKYFFRCYRTNPSGSLKSGWSNVYKVKVK